MARRKAVKVNRPTLEEVKAQPGKHVIAMLEGGVGPYSMAAIPPLYAPADAYLPHLLLEPLIPKKIEEMWLDDGRFVRLYNQHDFIKVWRSDELPETPNLMELPSEVDRALLEARGGPLLKHNAYRVATSDYDKVSKMLVWAKNDTLINPRQILEWELREVRPFLMAVRVYERRFRNRREVLSDVEKRLTEIAEKTSVEAQMAL